MTLQSISDTIKIIPPPRVRRCIATTLTDSQLQSNERESANKSLFARELVIGTLTQTLAELTLQQHQQQQQQLSAVQTPVSNIFITSPEAPSASTTLTSKKINQQHDTKRDHHHHHQPQSQTQPQQQQQPQQQVSTVTGTTTTGNGTTTKANVTGQGTQSQATTACQGLPSNPSGIGTQNSSMVQTLMHSVLPQPLVSFKLLFLFDFIYLFDLFIYPGTATTSTTTNKKYWNRYN